jgi:hypothetical protein
MTDMGSDTTSVRTGRARNDGATGDAQGGASGIAEDAKQAGGRVAESAKEGVSNVAEETKSQARRLAGEAASELRVQAADQQHRVADQLRTAGDELDQMARASSNRGMATELVHEAAYRTSTIAQWLEARDPDSVLWEVKQFARRRPGVFIAAAIGVGIVAGRVTRALAESSADAGDASGGTTGGSVGYTAPSTGATTGPTIGYTTGAMSGMGDESSEPAHRADTDEFAGDVTGDEGYRADETTPGLP